MVYGFFRRPKFTLVHTYRNKYRTIFKWVKNQYFFFIFDFHIFFSQKISKTRFAFLISYFFSWVFFHNWVFLFKHEIHQFAWHICLRLVVRSRLHGKFSPTNKVMKYKREDFKSINLLGTNTDISVAFSLHVFRVYFGDVLWEETALRDKLHLLLTKLAK